MSSSATDGGGGRLVSAMASTASEASTSSNSSGGNEHSERQVKFAVPTCSKSSSSNCNSNGPDGTGGTSAKPAGTASAKGKGGMSKVFQRSCSSAGVLGSLSKQQSLVKNPTEKDEKPASGILSNIPEDKVSLVFTYPLNFVLYTTE